MSSVDILGLGGGKLNARTGLKLTDNQLDHLIPLLESQLDQRILVLASRTTSLVRNWKISQ